MLSDENAVLDIGVGLFNKDTGGTQSPLFFAIGGHFSVLVMDRSDAESNVLPAHLFTLHVGIEFEHPLHGLFELNSADNGNFGLVELCVGSVTTLAVDEVVVFVDKKGLNGADENEGVKNAPSVFFDLFDVATETL